MELLYDDVRLYVRCLKQDCAFIFDNEATTNGTFTSPNYPGLYPRNVECHYLFYGADKSRVHITFAYFDVDGIPPRSACFHSSAVENFLVAAVNTFDSKE